VFGIWKSIVPPLPIISAKELIKFLEFRGFFFIRQKGSHKRYKNSFGKAITIPDHGKTNLKRGLLNGILNDLEIPVEELIEFLGK
jgi:predicted RNA binding protein YcfA (HicA-like mRNA interferase family)